MVCDMAAKIAPGDDLVGFAALTHDLGKALTPSDELPKHILHEQRGLDPVRDLCARLKVPIAHRDLALSACREHLNVHRLFELRSASIHDLIARNDGFRLPQRIALLAKVCEADKRGRGGMSESDYPQAAELLKLHEAAQSVRGADVMREGLQGPALGEALRVARIDAIRRARAKKQ